MGKMVEVLITETGKHFLKGKVTRDNPVVTPGLVPPMEKGVVSGLKNVRFYLLSFLLLDRNCPGKNRSLEIHDLKLTL